MSENNAGNSLELTQEEAIRLEMLMDVVASERNAIEGIRQSIIRAQDRLKGYSDQLVTAKGGDTQKNYQFDRENTKLVEIVEHSHDHTHDHSHEHDQEASDVTTV